MDYVDRNLEETHLPFTIPMGQDISFAKIFEKYISETQKIGQNTCCLNENSARPTAYFLHWVPRRILSAAAAALTLCKLTPHRAALSPLTEADGRARRWSPPTNFDAPSTAL